MITCLDPKSKQSMFNPRSFASIMLPLDIMAIAALNITRTLLTFTWFLFGPNKFTLKV